MKDELGIIRSIKAYALVMLNDIKRVKPIVRLKGIWFKESDFTIRFEITYKDFPESRLCLGDVCQLLPKFYYPLIGFQNLPEAITERLQKTFIIIAFVEINSRNHCDLLCVLGEGDRPDVGSLKIQKEEDRLLLFWLEGLKKIEAK